jgi:hypothetical protein
MLVDFFPRDHRRYSSLPLFGTVLDDFAGWLSVHGYNPGRICRHLRTTSKVDEALRSRSCRCFEEIARDKLRDCAPARAKDDPEIASTVRLWERYLEEHGRFEKPQITRTEELLGQYSLYLDEVRGV